MQWVCATMISWAPSYTASLQLWSKAFGFCFLVISHIRVRICAGLRAQCNSKSQEANQATLSSVRVCTLQLWWHCNDAEIRCNYSNDWGELLWQALQEGSAKGQEREKSHAERPLAPIEQLAGATSYILISQTLLMRLSALLKTYHPAPCSMSRNCMHWRCNKDCTASVIMIPVQSIQNTWLQTLGTRLPH